MIVDKTKQINSNVQSGAITWFNEYSCKIKGTHLAIFDEAKYLGFYLNRKQLTGRTI